MQRRREALVKPKFRQALVDLIKEAGAADGCPKSQGALLYTTASKVGLDGSGSSGVGAVRARQRPRNGSASSWVLQEEQRAVIGSGCRRCRRRTLHRSASCLSACPSTVATPKTCLPCHLQYPANALTHRGELLAYITSDRIRSNAQLDGALDYLGKVIGSGVQARTGWGNG